VAVDGEVGKVASHSNSNSNSNSSQSTRSNYIHITHNTARDAIATKKDNWKLYIAATYVYIPAPGITYV
jgi:hypothetical protein